MSNPSGIAHLTHYVGPPVEPSLGETLYTTLGAEMEKMGYEKTEEWSSWEFLHAPAKIAWQKTAQKLLESGSKVSKK